MRPVFDERDASILQSRIASWNCNEGPRVGDFVHMPDGTLRRFTHDWGDEIQTTVGAGPCAGDSSFYFGDGYMNFSGSLDPCIPKSALSDTGELRDGSCWFFHHDYMTAHNGVYTKAPCRVYRYKGES